MYEEIWWFTKTDGKRVGLYADDMKAYYEVSPYVTAIKYMPGNCGEVEVHEVMISFNTLMNLLGKAVNLTTLTKPPLPSDLPH